MEGVLELDEVSIDYDALVYVSDPQQSLLCPVCKNVLLDPLQTPCSHLMCARCVERSLDEKLECPVDRTRMPLGLAECASPPRWIYHVIEELEVVCPNLYCGRTFPRSSLKWHLRSECACHPLPCPAETCHRTVPRGRYNDSACEHVEIACVHCEKIVMLKDMPSHLDDCNELSHECKHCSVEFSAEDMRHHICDLGPSQCAAHEFGCLFVSTRLLVNSHEESCVVKLLMPYLTAQKAKVANLELENRALKDAVERLENVGTIEPTIEISSEYLNDRTYLFQTLETLSTGLDNLSASMATLDTKHSHITMHEAARTKDELAMIRLGVQGLRLQWHHFVQNSRGVSGLMLQQVQPPVQAETGDHRSQPARQGSDGSRVKL